MKYDSERGHLMHDLFTSKKCNFHTLSDASSVFSPLAFCGLWIFASEMFHCRQLLGGFQMFTMMTADMRNKRKREGGTGHVMPDLF